jgi:hypothetical protein
MTVTVGNASVSRVLAGSYGSLIRQATGASNIEGESTTLHPIPPGASGAGASTVIQRFPGQVILDADFGTEPPFAPRLQRSPGLTGFTADPETLTESLGGGIYRSTAPASGLPTEFYRHRDHFSRPEITTAPRI